MRVIDLYKHDRKVPWITLGIVFACFVVTFIACIQPDMYERLAWCNSPKYVWQYVSGVFLHGVGTSVSMAIIHLMSNVFMFVPYAIMIERMIGHKRFIIVFLSSWLGISIAFQIIAWVVAKGEPAYGAGLSGSAYAVIVIGAYILYKVFLLDKKKFFKQPLSYFFIFGLIGEILMLAPGVAGVESMTIHITGVMIGILMIILFKKAIDLAISNTSEKSDLYNK